MSFTVRPLTAGTWTDVVQVFGGGAGKGDAGRCWCQWWRMPRRDALQTAPRDALKAAFRQEVAASVPGLVGYSDGIPVGWVRIGPRSAVPEWSRAGRVTAPPDPADADDPAIWGISCFVVRVGHRRLGHLDALLAAAVAHARDHGAACVDACPVETAGKTASTSLFHGPAAAFRRAGFAEVARRRPNRPLMRLVL